MPSSTGPATADTRAATPGSTTSLGSASSSASVEPEFGSVMSGVKALDMVKAWFKISKPVRNSPDRSPGRTPSAKPRSGNKKERVLSGPLSLRGSYEKMNWR
ncbi:hypothetical protein ACVWW2_000679 [Bradyrhizobium sp. LM4.3]